MTHEHEHFRDIIADMPACMLVTADENLLRARPLAPFVDKQSRTIQFVTDSDSAKVEELLKHRKLCLTFADTKKCSLHPYQVAAASQKTENLSRNSEALIVRPFFRTSAIVSSSSPFRRRRLNTGTMTKEACP